ncbi:hypothetical protein VKT23_004809 [Stygiomarasmius scandens]|uniref:Brain protein I3 n=1 Tax=Marasmiellus scandens TaxID=2682957 RepID=A0ABR1JTC5_9AGAR
MDHQEKQHDHSVPPYQNAQYPPAPYQQPSYEQQPQQQPYQQPPYPPAAGQHPSYVMQSQPALEAGDQYRSQLWAMCARGAHDPETKYGCGGIVIAILLFPFGLIALFIDRERRCARCGVRL